MSRSKAIFGSSISCWRSIANSDECSTRSNALSSQGLPPKLVDSIRMFSKSTSRQLPTRLQFKHSDENSIDQKADNGQAEEEVHYTRYEERCFITLKNAIRRKLVSSESSPCLETIEKMISFKWLFSQRKTWELANDVFAQSLTVSVGSTNWFQQFW